MITMKSMLGYTNMMEKDPLTESESKLFDALIDKS